MAKIIYDDIQGIEQSWENFAGSSVEKFIKQQLQNKAGYIYRSQNKEGDYYYLYGFTDYEQYEAWAGGDSSITPLFRVQLPNIENDTFSANLTTNSNTTKIVNLGDGVIVGLKYTSTATNPTTHQTVDTGNDGTLVISRSANGSAFSVVGRVIIQSTPYAQDTYRNYDLTNYLVDGDNKIRLRVEDNVNGSISTNLTFQSVVNTTLAIENATPTSTPLTALQFQYYIQGQVAKTLHVNIKQGSINQTYNYPIGENTYIEVPYTTPLIELAVESGIIEVDAWITIDDSDVSSYHEISQFYFSDGTETETVIILNNVNTNIINYTNAHLFDMTLYNQGADVEIRVQSPSGDSRYLTLNYNNCQTGVVYSVYATLEIEGNADTIPAMVLVNSKDFNCTPYSITVDNSEKMSPVEGADFVLNPKIRNNSETNPNRIINSVNGNVISSTFTGFGFLRDGWVADEDNINVLRIPANHNLQIDYDVFSNLRNGTSIELDYKVYNIFNDNDEVIKMYSTNENQQVLGFVMNATEAAFYTSENQTKRDQDVIFQEGERTHMVINIVPNLANSGLNYIRIFINGVINREMLYSDNDVFKTGTVSMIFGSQNCDIDIYGIRVYKTGLSASDVRQNYMSSLPDIESKIAFKNANNILSANGTISYDRAKVLYNTLVWTGNVPSYSTGDRSYQGSLEINILDDAAHSGNITGLTIKGQGSSSKKYWKWNHQYDWNKNGLETVWTDGNGETHTDGYPLTDDDPAATKLVAKLNWASSMQSHKLGSTAMYTDLWKDIIGGNGITNTRGYEKVRVSVHEKPFLYFVRETPNAQPVFYGLMTFGSGKYDKPTFGYDKNVFPDYLILEGSDNGKPLTLRQVPWFEDEVPYSSLDEAYLYKNEPNLDYGMGKQENISYFIDAFNFTYLHSPFLVAFTGSIPSDADYKNQYWDTATRNVYRFDYLNEEWVNAGATKTNGAYDVLNLETQTGLLRSNYASDAEYQEAVIAWRKTDFKNRISTYYNVNDVLFSMAFLKFIAASDNWCKNTYEYLDPVTHKICLAQDDMDTLFLTDNVGRKTKPYYCEEHDLDGENKPYFNGSDNVFFNLMEMAFDSEEKNMLRQIFNAMTNRYDSVRDCMQHYYFDVQDYFPAVCYNETARLLYEEASVKQSQGIYDNGTPAISQSLGDQKQAEKQFINKRITYLQSWSSSHPFYVRSTVEPSLNFRSMTTVGGVNPSYRFNLITWQYLYPKVGTGQYISIDNTRVPARNTYQTINMLADGNTDTFIYGSDYYTSFGEFGGVSLSETFNLNGKRLLEFSADSRLVSEYNFRPSRMTVVCPELRTFCVYGCSTLSGNLDLSGCTKLTSVDLRGTNLSSVVLPQTDTLRTVYLPELTSITIVNCPNIQTLSIEGYNNIISLTTDSSSIAADVIGNAPNLTNVVLYNVNINTNYSNVNRFVNLLTSETSNCSITGYIYLDIALNNNQLSAIENKFGESVWNSDSEFYISYIYNNITSLSLSYATGNGSIFQNDSLVINIITNGNNIRNCTWTLNNTIPLTTVESRGKLEIKTTTFNTIEEFTATLTLTTTTGDVLTSSINITACYLEFSFDNQPLRNSVIDVITGEDEAGSSYWNKRVSVNVNPEYSGTVSVNQQTSQGGVWFENESETISTMHGNQHNIDGYVSEVYGGFIIDSTYYVWVPFKIRENLIEFEIGQISDINCHNGSATAHVSLSVPLEYSQYFNLTNVYISDVPQYTISNKSSTGFDINLTGVSTNVRTNLAIAGNFTMPNGVEEARFYKTSNYFNITNVETGFIFRATYSGPSSFSNSSDSVASIMNNPSGCNNYYLFSNVVDCKGLPTQTGNIVLKGEYKVKINSTNTTYTLTYDTNNDRYYVEDPTDNTKVLMYMQNEAKPTVRINQNAFNSSSDESVVVYMEYPKTYTNANGNTAYLDQNQLEYLYSSNNYLTDLHLEQPAKITIGYSTTYPTLPHNLCQNCTNLRSVEIGFTDSAGNTGSYMFDGCTSLTTVVLTKIYSIANMAFRSCTSLTSINLPEGVKRIDEYTFYRCSNLTSITLPSTVTNISNHVFSECPKVSSIIINSNTAPSISQYTWGYNSYTTGYNSGTTNVLYVPSDATGYDTTNWTGFLLNSTWGKFTLSKTL